jgi:phosphoglycolate phosphatase
MKFENLIFDLDGTLLDSSLDIISSLEKAYALESFDNVIVAKSNIGPKLSDLIDTITPKLEIKVKNKIIGHYRSIYDNLSTFQSSLYSSVVEVLTELKRNDFKLFIATNKPLKPTLSVLKHFEIFHFFQDIYTPDCISQIELDKIKMIESILNKFKLFPKKTIMIGDHPSDIIAAKKNNIISAGVLYGFAEPKEILSEHPEYIVNSINDLLFINHIL